MSVGGFIAFLIVAVVAIVSTIDIAIEKAERNRRRRK